MAYPLINIPGDLEAGDILLYQSPDLTDKLIEWKEGDPDTAHVEVYIGAGVSVASRNGIGVNSYKFRPDGLMHVRRPTCVFHLDTAMNWFVQVKGAPYGWGDIGATLNLVEKPEDAWTKPEILVQTGMDCDHLAAMFLRAGLVNLFDVTFDYRKLTPRDFKLPVNSQGVWDAVNQRLVTSSPTNNETQAAPADLSPRAPGEQIQKVN